MIVIVTFTLIYLLFVIVCVTCGLRVSSSKTLVAAIFAVIMTLEIYVD